MKTYSKISGDPKKVWDEVEVQSLNLTEFAVMNSVALTPVTPSEIEANINIRNNVAAGYDEVKAIPIK